MKNDNIAISCQSLGNPTPSYRWYHNNVFLSNSAVLSLKSIKMENAGEYVCRASAGNAVKATSVTVKVNYLQQPSLDIFSSTILQEGSYADLSCNSKSNVGLKYQWYKNNIRITGSSNEFVINHVNRNDAGNYTCIAFSKFGNMTSRVRSVVVHFLDVPVITPSKPFADVTENDVFTLTCKSLSNPAPSYHWYHNNVVISYSSVFTITNVKVENAGEYICKATAGIITKVASAIVNVNYLQVPHINIFPSPMIPIGTSFILTCNSTSSLSINYKWFINDALIPTMTEQQFIVTKATVDHSGFYKCEVYNTIGSRTSHKVIMTIQDLDHCLSNITECDKNAECFNGLATYYCRCKQGYEGDGKTCSLIKRVVSAKSTKDEKKNKVLLFTTVSLSTLVVVALIISASCWIAVLRKRKEKERKLVKEFSRRNESSHVHWSRCVSNSQETPVRSSQLDDMESKANVEINEIYSAEVLKKNGVENPGYREDTGM